MDFQQVINLIDPLGTIFYGALFAFAVLLITIVVQLFVLVFWKRVDGKVVETSLGEKKGRKGMRYFPKIRYTYSYKSQEYTGDSPWVLRQTHKSRERVQGMLDANPPGKSIKVLVNPFVAGQSVLIHDVNPFYLVIFFMGLIITGFFALMAYLMM